MKVVNCDNCGLEIAADALSSGKAIQGDDGKAYCAQCAPFYEERRAVRMSASNEPAPAHSVTKFYFCETCGKRITDKQILEGLARDKKLKGVYCQNCAVGVMTMEMDAVNLEHLTKPKSKTHAAAPSGDAINRPRRKSSDTARAYEYSQRPLPGKPMPATKSSQFQVLLAGAAVFLIVGCIVAVVAIRNKPVPHDRVSSEPPIETSAKIPPSPIVLAPAPPIQLIQPKPSAPPVPPVYPESAPAGLRAPSAPPASEPPMTAHAPAVANKSSVRGTPDFASEFNHALAANGGKASGGNAPERLIDGVLESSKPWAEAGIPGDFFVVLANPVPINCIHLRLWDGDDRFYRYKLWTCASDKSETWELVADNSGPDKQCKSWQTLKFSERTVKRIRLSGTYNSNGAAYFHVIEVQAFRLKNE